MKKKSADLNVKLQKCKDVFDQDSLRDLMVLTKQVNEAEGNWDSALNNLSILSLDLHELASQTKSKCWIRSCCSLFYVVARYCNDVSRNDENTHTHRQSVLMISDKVKTFRKSI